jgi:hypothetical protein
MKTKVYSVECPAVLDQLGGKFVAYSDSQKDIDRVYIGLIIEGKSEMPDYALVSYYKEGFTEAKLNSYIRTFIDCSIDFKRAIIEMGKFYL